MSEDIKQEEKFSVKRMIIGKSLKQTLIRTAVLAVAALLIFKLLLLPVQVNGASMLPTYRSGNFTFINRLSYTFGNPSRGDIVAIKTTGVSVMYLKRIVGIPGDAVEFRTGSLFINNAPVEEPYLNKGCDWKMELVAVGEDEYFVVGDNRTMSIGSHVFGIITESKIVGRPLF